MWSLYTSLPPELGTQMSPKAAVAGNGVFPAGIVWTRSSAASSSAPG